MDLEALIRELMGKPVDQVVTALQNTGHAIYQAIFDRGHGTATTASAPEITRIQGLLTKAEEKLATAERTAQESGQQPADWQRQRDQYETTIRNLTGELATAKAGADQVRTESTRTLKLSDLERKLALGGDPTKPNSRKKIRPEYAKFMVSQPEVANRVKVEGDSIQVLRAGMNIPLSVAEGQDVLEVLADELAAAVDPVFHVVRGDRGSGLSSGDAPAGGGSFLKDLKDRVTEERKKKEESGSNISLQDRLRTVR